MSIFEDYKQFRRTNIPKAPLFCETSGKNVRLRMLKLKTKANELMSSVLDKLNTFLKSSNYIIGLSTNSALTVHRRAKSIYSSLVKSQISLYKTWYFLDFASYTHSQYNNSPPFALEL
jgi:subtilase family serine protease